MSWNEFLGNDQLCEEIRMLIHNNRIPQAIVIEGEKGSGRKTLAKTIAKALLCKGEYSPCGKCVPCKKVEHESHPDIKIISSSTKSNIIPIDEIRKIRSDAFIQPNESERKIYIFSGDINVMGQNALLKILEEPPSYAVFILICESATSLLSTVRSRTTTFTVRELPRAIAVKGISARLPKTEIDEIEQAVDIWGGYIGQVVQGLEEGTLSKATAISTQILKEAVSSKEIDLLTLLFTIQKDREYAKTVFGIMIIQLRNALTMKITGKEIKQNSLDHILLRKLSRKQMCEFIELAQQTRESMKRNANMNLLMTHFSSNIKQISER